MTTIRAGDMVEIRALPGGLAALSPDERCVYEACLGLTLNVSVIDTDGCCVIRLGQAWEHFPGVVPFDLRFEPSCLRTVAPFTDDEWRLVGDWMERDATIAGTVAVVDGRAVVLLEGGPVAELAWPDPSPAAGPADLVGSRVEVRIIVLNRKRRELVVMVVT